MNNRRTALIILIVLSISIISPVTSIHLVNSLDYTIKKDKYVILFDEAHYQSFTHQNFSIGFVAVNETLQREYGVSIEIKTIDTPFNRTNLQFADLLFITNPGLFPNGTVYSFQKEELQAIKDYLNLGGNVFLSGNPFIPNANYSGHVGPLNQILKEIYIGGIRFYSDGVDKNESTVIVNDFINDGNESHVLVNQSYILSNTVFEEPFNATNFVVYSQSITLDPLVAQFEDAKKRLIGQTPPTSYTVLPGYSVTQIYERPAWLAYFEAEEQKGRTIVSGSTIMFSDMVDSYNNQTWIKKADHEKLFVNIIAWLLHLSPTEKIDTTLEKSVGYLMLLEIVAGVGVSLIVFVILYLYLFKLKTSKRTFASLVKKEKRRSEKMYEEKSSPKKDKKKKKKRGK